MCEKTETRKCIFCQLTERIDSVAEDIRTSETAKHLHNACKEMLLAVRSLVDEAINRKEQKAQNRLQKVPVE